MAPTRKLFIEVTQHIQKLINNQQFEEAESILQEKQLSHFLNKEWSDNEIKPIVEKEISNYNKNQEHLYRRWRSLRKELLKQFDMSLRKKRKTEALDSPSATGFTPLSFLASPPRPSYLPNYDASMTYPLSAQAHYGAVAYSMHHDNSEDISSNSQPGQALAPVSENQEYETMSDLVKKGCVLESVDPVHELESQFGDFKLIQDHLNESGIVLHCTLAEGTKAAKQMAHDMARTLSELAKHTRKMRGRFMEASINEVDENESTKRDNNKKIQDLTNKIQQLTSENSEIDNHNEKINQFIAKMKDVKQLSIYKETEVF